MRTDGILDEALADTAPAAGRESAVRLALLYPELLGTYGDGGNALVLAKRLEWRGIPCEVVTVEAGDTVPDSCDLYLLGGGEDGPQTEASRELIRRRSVHRAVERGAVVFAVCAGYQLLGTSFYAKGAECTGLGLLDLRSDRGETRAVGELAGPVDPVLSVPPLTGFENHGGRTHLGPAAKPLVSVQVGIGNDGNTEGAWAGKLLGTYAHGPALARNPALADLLVGWAVGSPLPPADDSWPDRLRAERLSAVGMR